MFKVVAWCRSRSRIEAAITHKEVLFDVADHPLVILTVKVHIREI
jgi:hypothetical protein